MKKAKINLNYFEKPKSRIANNFALKKYNFSSIEINESKPCIFLTPCTSKIDYNLITKCIKTKFVFVKKNIVSELEFNTLANSDKQKLVAEINYLAEFGYSFSIVWGSEPCIFGKNIKPSSELCEFLKEINLDIKFLTFPNEFFALPFWADNARETTIFSNKQIEIKSSTLKPLSKKEATLLIQNSIPSSANSYTNKFPLKIKSNNSAVNLERVIYACPNCKKLLSLYSEFSCLKCTKCGKAVEIGNDGKFLFSPYIFCYDDIENFQFSCLKKHDFNIHKLIEYKNIIQIFDVNCRKPVKISKILQIYARKFILINPITNKKDEFYYENIESVYMTLDNKLVIKPENAKEFQIFGKRNENLLIIKDLVKINKN